jgi:hypothetical protein
MKGTLTMQEKITKELLESARQFARLGLNAASTAVGYAAKVLGDVEKELKDSSAKFTKPAEPSQGEQQKV